MPQPDTVRAAVFLGPGQPLALREFPLPQLQAGEILVRVTCCTVCSSDLHTYTGRRISPAPSILGHEILGRIAAFGPKAARCDAGGGPLREGDRVTWSIAAGCGRCFFCRHHLPQNAWQGSVSRGALHHASSNVACIPPDRPREYEALASPSHAASTND